MATVQTIVDAALRKLGKLASGETPTASESQDCLSALNGILDSWQTSKLYVFALTETALTLTPGDASYTVGPSGNFNITPRPVELMDVYIVDGGISYPVNEVQVDRWDAIPDKTVETDIPDTVYYNPTIPTGTLQIWPVPNKAVSLRLVTWQAVGQFASLGTIIQLPPGYERALTYALAVEMASEFGMEPPQSVVAIAESAKAAIKRANIRPMKALTELGIMMSMGKSDIVSGGMVA